MPVPARARSWSARAPTSPRSRGSGLTGESVTFSGDGLLARCLQHETDHITGTVFGDRLPNRLRRRLQKAHDKADAGLPRGLARRVTGQRRSAT